MSSEFYINIKDKPKWADGVNFSNQSRDVQEFYKNEARKLRDGITIGGVKIHPWLYWHVNYWSIFVDVSRTERKLLRPELRDNEWYWSQLLLEAEKDAKGIILFGTRRFGKSAFISSYIAFNATMKYGSFNSVVGGAQGDLDNVTSYIDIGLENVPEFFRYNRVGKDWSKGITLGTRTKSNKRNIFSTMTVTNVDSGKTKATQKTAGATPSSFVIDEIGKFPVKKTFNAAKYSFSTQYGWRVTPILIGTGGEVSLSQDAQEILAKPSIHNLIEMNWNWLEDYCENPTWEKKTWGIFVPAQMSIEPGLIKRDTDLGEYLGVKDKFLAKIKVKVTEWDKSSKILEDRRKELEKDRDSLLDEMMFLPLTPDDCFLQSGENPFPTIVGRNHINKITESGNTGRPVELYRSNGKIGYDISNKRIAKFPFEGGNIDSPVLIFENPPTDNSIDSTYVAGLDHYKHDKASTDSVGALYVFKRKVNLDGYANHIVASFCSRPTSIDKFNEVAELLIEAYGSECLQENADVSFEQHLRRKNKASIWLAQGEELARKYANPKSTQNNKYGLVPNAKNKNYLLGLVISYAQEDIELGYDKDENKIFMKGIERINDVALLEEMVNFKYGANHDRITSFGHALAWARYLDDLNIIPKVKMKTDTSMYKKQFRKQKLKYRSPYSTIRGKMYRQ